MSSYREEGDEVPWALEDAAAASRPADLGEHAEREAYLQRVSF